MGQDNTQPLLIVAIGPSAGGLEACEIFFKHMPADAGIAFAVVMHLVPDHESALAQLLARYPQMSVEHVRENTRVVPNRIYIIASDSTLTIKNGLLQVTLPAEPHGSRMPVASLFLQTVREPLLILDADLRVQSANKSFYELFKASEYETTGQDIFDLGNRQWDIPELRRLLGEVLPQSKAVRDFRVEQNFPDLGRRIMLVSAGEIPQDKDHAPLILLAIDDITESRDLLLKTNEELRHFAYATSHDLQESLRMVVSYTQLLAREYKGRLDGEADRFIAHAVEGALRMETLLKDLRGYWSVNEHWLKRPVPVDSNRVCEEILQVLNEAVRESGATVTYEQLPAVLSEEISMRLLFQNLIGNAIKYRRPGASAQIHIRARRKAGLWRFSVADNGIGIDTEHLETIFAPFKRLHGQDKYPGSGLGLAICKKIIERAGGQIWAESVYGQGSTFNFTLPAKDGDV